MLGIELPEAKELVDRFEEAVQVVDLVLRQDVTSFEGRHYQLHDAPFRPRPVQQPRPPLTIGAHGRRMLGIVARWAESWNSHGTVDEIRARNSVLDEQCDKLGRDPSTVLRSLYYWIARSDEDPWSSLDAFHDLVGRYRQAGVTEFVIDLPRPDQEVVLERVAAEALPALSAAQG